MNLINSNLMVYFISIMRCIAITYLLLVAYKNIVKYKKSRMKKYPLNCVTNPS